MNYATHYNHEMKTFCVSFDACVRGTIVRCIQPEKTEK